MSRIIVKRVVPIGLGLLGLLGALIWLFAVERFDRFMNPVVADPAAPAPTAADIEFHRSLFVADLHADTLKWDRDLLARADYGHVDLPRLVDGHVGLQVFSIVTRSPLVGERPGFPGETCAPEEGINVATVLAAIQGRPVRSQRQRALWQAARLRSAVQRSLEGPGPELRLIRTADDLRRLLADRRSGRAVVGAVLAIEGGHWVGDPALGAAAVESDMRELFEAGVRMFAPTHRFDNSLSGASEGCARGGLTERGLTALREAERLGIVVDLAHISPAGLRDALGALTKPFVISHTGIRTGCEAPCRPARNLAADEIAAILRAGGLIGIGYWPQAIGSRLARLPEVMAHVMSIARREGLEPGRGVALGADYDGSVTVPFDVSGVPIVTTLLRRHPAFEEPTIRAVMGLNTCRLLARTLPGGSEALAEATCDPAGGPPLSGAAAAP